MSFTDEEFDRLEKEVATLFMPPAPRESGPADRERIDRIMDRVDAAGSAEADDDSLIDSSSDTT